MAGRCCTGVRSQLVGVASFQQTASDLEAKLSGASANVEKYLSEKCGLTAPSESATPTS